MSYLGEFQHLYSTYIVSVKRQHKFYLFISQWRNTVSRVSVLEMAELFRIQYKVEMK